MPEHANGPLTPGGQRGSAAGNAGVWALVDVVLIVVFAASGRRTHQHGLDVSGVLETAWPFLLAYVLTALATRAWRSPAALVPTALLLWAGTVIGGLTLRALTGAGVAMSFQIVTLLVLGAFLVLPRAVARTLGRNRHREPVA
ncbi:DUF3054 domain-containing protein [Arthrobacter sp. NamB2]|uniref:DUF3054 domain-containing protein n=1 Tax=Arthrobacter sp. NamB2 TaxID=2576035 RepID=UPI0010C9EFED|nr:DUF3054 domain-containing protein [Arthrobacter sp. NamB2]TKV26841.1 DUF3054 domain-containing protein [Arthrobacter sp. NamB2]